MKNRICRKCGIKFAPKAAHQMYCDGCRYKKCLVCGKIFYAKPAEKRKYCSCACSDKIKKGREATPIQKAHLKKLREINRGRKTGKFVRCSYCGKKIYRYPRDLKRSYQDYYCSWRCRSLNMKGKPFSLKTQYKKGKENRRWKGGKTISNRKRAKKRWSQLKNGGGILTKKEWEQIKKRNNFCCVICRKREPEIKLTKDHIISVDKWNSWKNEHLEIKYRLNDPQNIQALCGHCNSKKSNHLV